MRLHCPCHPQVDRQLSSRRGRGWGRGGRGHRCTRLRPCPRRPLLLLLLLMGGGRRVRLARRLLHVYCVVRTSPLLLIIPRLRDAIGVLPLLILLILLLVLVLFGGWRRRPCGGLLPPTHQPAAAAPLPPPPHEDPNEGPQEQQRHGRQHKRQHAVQQEGPALLATRLVHPHPRLSCRGVRHQTERVGVGLAVAGGERRVGWAVGFFQLVREADVEAGRADRAERGCQLLHDDEKSLGLSAAVGIDVFLEGEVEAAFVGPHLRGEGLLGRVLGHLPQLQQD
mmetsp:Transcript_17880/g.42996  ORF Transcript_17880/g.42996 Transcript_17880/m.42996 type:complete len:281 (+) Transcript_17880:49-891(+)